MELYRQEGREFLNIVAAWSGTVGTSSVDVLTVKGSALATGCKSLALYPSTPTQKINIKIDGTAATSDAVLNGYDIIRLPATMIGTAGSTTKVNLLATSALYVSVLEFDG